MRISEIFGPTVQGEGPSAGRLAAFVRLAGCNLACRWCDTPYSWDWTGKLGKKFDPLKETENLLAPEIVARVEETGAPLVVITGGEPLIHAARLQDLSRTLIGLGLEIEVETNGTRLPHGDMLRSPRVRFNVSPKLDNSGEPVDHRIVPDVLQAFASRPDTAFKFVVAEPEDIAEIEQIVALAGAGGYQVWLMPEGTDAETQVSRMGWLADEAIRRGWNFSPRLHVLAWGDRRGV